MNLLGSDCDYLIRSFVMRGQFILSRVGVAKEVGLAINNVVAFFEIVWLRRTNFFAGEVFEISLFLIGRC